MTLTPPEDAPIAAGAVVLERTATELLWSVTCLDGRPAVLGQLLPQLARIDAVRQRYDADVERLARDPPPGLAPLVASGAAWRLRSVPEGETLEAWIAREAPAEYAAATARFVALLEVLDGLHARGLVARDLEPRKVVIAPDGRVTLTDLGLARVGILSTRSTASLVVGRSPYRAPEQLTRTVVDARSDLFVVAVMWWRALTGVLPFDSGSRLDLSTAAPPPPSLSSVRPDAPVPLERLLVRCLAGDAAERPATAREVIALALGRQTAVVVQHVACQGCGASMWTGQRLCLACGREGVQLIQSDALAPEDRWAVDLVSATEDAEATQALERYLTSIADAKELPIELDLVTGNALLHSKEDLARAMRLPLRLAVSLDRRTSERIAADLTALGLDVRATREVETGYRTPALRALMIVGGAALVIAQPMAAVVTGALFALSRRVRRAVMGLWRGVVWRPSQLLLELRAAPAALVASDPWVRRLAERLTPRAAADLRAQVGRLALSVEALVRRRAELVDLSARADVDRAAELVGPLVALIAGHVDAIEAIDTELADLDEGVLLRGLAAYDRPEDRDRRASMLAALARIGELEEQRTRRFARLLRGGELLERAVAVGLDVEDPEREAARCLAEARAELGL